MLVIDYSHKKLVEYLEPGIKVLIDFPHGMGDDVMFMPLFLKLKFMYPETQIDLKVAAGREDFCSPPEPLANYKYIFKLVWHETHDKPGKYSKPEYCCIRELGIPFTKELDFTWQPPKMDSPLIGVNFMCNSNPNYNVPYAVAKQIYNNIKDNGLIPLEIYFEHAQYNNRNSKYDFISATTRGVRPSVSAFVGAMQQCRAFIGVNSGSLCMATALYSSRVIHLHTRHSFSYYHKFDDTYTMDATGFTRFNIQEFDSLIKKIKNNQPLK